MANNRDLKRKDTELHARKLVSTLANSELNVYKEAFALFDKDGDGVIGVDEIEHVLKAVGRSYTAEHLKLTLKRMDIYGNGTVEFAEFLKLMGLLKSTSPNDIKDWLKELDPSSAGIIELGELRHALTKLGGSPLSDDDVDELLAALNFESGDGQVSIEDLVQGLYS
mmetsp:Transcript_16683/g.18562  ORF Transcript_16683/g.18562 Transcript_16683/m.18562 type:complete len:167 (+) Transcript_16683:30-530(+)|eukprot:CAMPEP_0168512950 /NCGR_PEP_ID=MMETSP0405-20121227/3137_1 /TAXON_ID=498012 /ORGANISM="Trichosphaerium sp, Strain Am-I-7 wt" /LENGTH=166 /DNA_ID=CAMNT_0008531619 /DNA_START=16 /DNA_END=516 /DNA_ORIENTATION=-